MKEDKYHTVERQRMVEEQLATRDISSIRVLEAFRTVPRHLFVPREHRHLAYADGPLPIGEGQTISQPYIVALMTQLLDLKGDETVLEVGTGSGYQAAILSYLARQVHTIERYEDLAKRASEKLEKLGYANIHVHVGDGTLGLPEFAPFDGILVTAAAPSVPRPLLEQLADKGRLVIPVGGRGAQFLECWQRQGSDYHCDQIAPVAFVPLIGKHGWEEEKWWW